MADNSGAGGICEAIYFKLLSRWKNTIEIGLKQSNSGCIDSIKSFLYIEKDPKQFVKIS
jgi:hypothetical protein